MPYANSGDEHSQPPESTELAASPLSLLPAELTVCLTLRPSLHLGQILPERRSSKMQPAPEERS
jgi:hypothetical protein